MPSNTHKNIPHPVDVHVGKRLRLQRSTLGLSQEDIGNRVGITFQQIQKYERGTNRIGSSRLWEFSQILEIPVRYFFQGLETDNSEAEESDENRLFENRETVSLLKFYHNIHGAEIRKAVLSLIRAIVTKD